MQIDITGHHIEVTDSLRDYVKGKFDKLERHFDNVVDVHVILTVEKLTHKAEATLVLSGARIFAEAVHEDMYAAIDALTDKLDRQVVKHKEKRADHHRTDGPVSQALEEE
ncbi:ribosome hibernation-promoting factor, HPF/YfiA family [Arhodomonas sp. SL1]|uniref:ribosome hibernation-promoting factor, HPF/YfiA family n=1 Tax=Arhodomonas sp. SL1 TaxID=3425691 RepID=UPI003F883532